MSITVKYLEGLGIEEETAKKIFAERGKEVEAEKAQIAELKAQLEAKDNDLASLSAEFETLKTNNASAEEIQKAFDSFKADVEEKERKAEEERKAKERAETIGARFASVVGDKKFVHDAIRESYLSKFSDAVQAEENASKSDADIFHELTKDDGNAFVGVTPIVLQGARQGTDGKSYQSRDEIMAIKDTSERQAAIAQNIDLFK